MGVAIYPNTASVIKSLQTGSASGAGTITISAVNTAKTVVHSVSTGSAGTVAATGTMNAANGSTSGISFSASSGTNVISNNPLVAGQLLANQGYGYYYTTGNYNARYQIYYQTSSGYIQANVSSNIYMNAMNTNGANVGLNATSLTGGTTALTAAAYGAVLTNSTTLTVTGPCTYQVIEYY